MSAVKNVKRRAEKFSDDACILCKQELKDDYRLGKFYRSKDLNVHHYCILFACGLAQNGRSTKEGIAGFLIDDVRSEVKRGRQLRCFYCRNKGATVGCYVRKCKKVFHVPCGQENGALNQFFGAFCSFCTDHKPKQEISVPKKRIQCCICYANETYSADVHLQSPCCMSGWFHRSCIQSYAFNAGYFFKCPLCNNKEEFRTAMLILGVHIPDQDASWEKERNAFQELLARPQCEAEKCRYAHGRNISKPHTLWQLIYCEDCGSTARHVGCAKMLKSKLFWRCDECREVVERLQKQKKEKKKAAMKTYKISQFSEGGGAQVICPTELAQFTDCRVVLEDVCRISSCLPDGQRSVLKKKVVRRKTTPIILRLKSLENGESSRPLETERHSVSGSEAVTDLVQECLDVVEDTAGKSVSNNSNANTGATSDRRTSSRSVRTLQSMSRKRPNAWLKDARRREIASKDVKYRVSKKETTRKSVANSRVKPVIVKLSNGKRKAVSVAEVPDVLNVNDASTSSNQSELKHSGNAKGKENVDQGISPQGNVHQTSITRYLLGNPAQKKQSENGPLHNGGSHGKKKVMRKRKNDMSEFRKIYDMFNSSAEKV